MATSTLGIKLDDETRSRLKNLGEIKRRSPHWLMKEAIQQFLDAEETYEKEKNEDERRYQHYLTTGQHVSEQGMKSLLSDLRDQAIKAGGITVVDQA